MASHRLKRTMQGALAATAVAAALGVVPTPATAVPPPDPTQQLNDLTKQAQLLNEEVHRAQDALAAKQNDLNQANAAAADSRGAAADARGHEDGYRQQVDKLANASFEGAQFSQLSALLTSSSTQQYLDQAAMLDVLAQQNHTSLSQLSAVVAQTAADDKAAQAAQQRAQQATDDAAKINNDLQQKQSALDTQIRQVKAQVNQLSAAAQNARASAGTIAASAGSFVAPPGIAGAAMQSALTQLGKPYVWGGASPSGGFDCSGLTLWAYAQHGVSLPHSAQMQMAMGQAVSRDALQPGDLVFFGTASNIHHVGIYVGNGQMVNASDFGIPVRVQSAFAGEDYYGARRLGG